LAANFDSKGNMPKVKPNTNNTWYYFLTLPGFKKYFANISWLTVEKIFRMPIVLIVGIYVARYLGPERFGLLNYAVSFVALFSIITTLGLDAIIVRGLVNEPDEQNKLLGTAFALRVVSSLLMFAVLAVVVLFTNSDSFTNLIILIIAAGLLFQSFNVIQFYFEAKVLSKYYVFSQLAALTIISITKLVFISMKLSLIYFASAIVAESIVLAVGLVIVYTKQKLSLFNWGFSFRLAYELLKDSWPLILSGVAVSIYMKIDQVMLKQMLNSEAVGQYAAAVKLSEAWYFVPIIICNSLFPAILNAKKHSDVLYYARLQKLYDLMLWTAIPITLVITFLASNIIHFVYGAPFSKAGTVLAIHIWASVFVFLGVASGKYLIAENYTRISFFRTFIGMVVNVVANIILIPRYEVNGAAVATVGSYFIATFGIIFIPKTRMQAVLMLKSVNPLHAWR
jgi:O-antigen/teichoic acid export membrane protein